MKRSRNRALAGLLSLCLLWAVFTILVSASPTDVIVEGDYAYSIEDDQVTIKAYYGTQTNIIIPSQLGGLPVTKIGDIAFHNTTAASILIPPGIVSVGARSFMDNRNMIEITIPSSMVTIGDMAFAYCSSLTNVVLSDGLTSIGSYAFAGCTNLKTITIPASVTSIGERAFNHGPWANPPQYPIPGLSIIGYEDTYTQRYARYNDVPFIAIKDFPADTPGDINADGAVDAADSLLALQQSVRLVALGDQAAVMADINQDGRIDAQDALRMLQIRST